ncbi:MAG TPA: TIM barrel protein [Bryobacteraceae bacterium]|nr:TIM barrel protein [Bryobacteraceae bacterium]
MTRRSFLPAAAVLAGAASAPAPAQTLQRKGRLKQGATRGCFGKMPFPEICKQAARLGLKGIDLVGPADWPVLKEHGLLCTMAPGSSGIRDGINRVENHPKMLEGMREAVQKAAAAGFPNVIVLSGERKGLPDEQGVENSVKFFNQIKGLAEDKGVTLCLELLNSKVNHPDYQCDRTAWGVEVCKRVNSARVKLLYDIYHMQIMEGDVIRTIRENVQWIGHFHTAGNPGRHEIDAGQELNYRPIAQAIVDLGFTGYFSHEYSPLKDPMTSLDEAIRICDV